MATIQKSTKINFYKFVGVKQSPASTANNAEQVALSNSLNNNTRAINNLGATLNSIAKIVTSLKSAALLELEASKKNAPKFEAQYFKKKKNNVLGAVAGVAKGVGNMWEGLMKMLGGLLKAAIIIPALEWLSKKENQKTVETVIDAMGKIARFIFDVAKFGVVSTIEGLYTLLSDESSPWEKIGGLVEGLTGLGTLLLGLRWLSNPTKIITDFGGVLKFLYNNLVRGKRGLLGRAGALGLVAAVGYGGYKLYESINDKEPKEQKSQGGSVKNLPSRSQGGFINGPQSGYKVSLDGGRSTSFIGHGSEYVARKANGGAFVIPLNTPGTKTQPNLTKKRLGEAKSQGYKVPNAMRQEYPVGRSLGGKLPQFSQGGAYLNKIKANDGTSGANANKKIFLHWSGGHRSNTEFHNGNGYHTFVPASGQPVRKARFGQKGRPYHTYGQNQATSAAIAVSGMNGYGSESASSWGAQAITPNQYKGMAKEAAGLATAWGWKPSDITDKRIRTHSEDYRDRPDWYLRSEPSHYRWDLNRLYAGDPEGSGPGKIRNMIKQQMAFFGGKTSKTDDPTRDGSDNRNRAPWNPFAGALDAVTGNMFDFDGAGKTTPPKSPTPAPSGPARTVAKADASVKVEPLPANFSDKQAFMHIYNIAKKVGGTKWPEIVAAQAMHETGYLKNPNSVYFASGKTNAFGQTGNRGHGIMPRPGDPSGWTKYPSLEEGVRDHIKLWHNVGNNSENYNAHDNIMDGIATIAPAYSPNADPANIRLGYTTDKYSEGMVRALKIGGFNPKTTRTGAAPAATASSSSSSSSSSSGSVETRGTGTQTLPASPMTILPARRANLADIGSSNTEELVQQTEKRNEAQRDVRQNSSTLLNTAMSAIAQQNGMNTQAIAAAKQAITQIASQSKPAPRLLGNGSSGGSSRSSQSGARLGSAASFNSMANTLRGLL
jgi:hypothetical protein